MQLAEDYREISPFKAVLTPWLVCLGASLFFFYELIQGNMFASIADNIMHDFNIQADKMAYLSSIYYLSNVLFLFVSGVLLDRFSPKKTLLVTMVLSVSSTFILAQAENFYVALACRFIGGIGSAFCFLGPIRIASRWFPPQRMAFVAGAIVTLGMTGGMLAQYPMAKLVALFGWRAAVVHLAWLGVIILVLMCWWIKEKSHHTVDSKYKKMSFLTKVKKAYFNRQTFCAALYTSLMNIPVAVFGALMGTLYLMQRLGISKEDAAMINSMLFIGAIIGGPMVGWMSDRLGLRLRPMKIGGILSLSIMLIILYCPLSASVMAILFLILGFCGATQVIGYALVAESSLPAMTAMAVSIVSLLTQGGYIIYQNIFSMLLSRHGGMQLINHVPVYSLGDFQAAAIILPLGLIIACLALLPIQETYCRQIQEE